MENLKFRIHCDTNQGMRRGNNEDCVVADESHSIIVLADGMGGHKAGEIASSLAANSVLHNLRYWLSKFNEKTITQNLKKAIIRYVNQANNKVYLESLLDYQKNGMGTTIVIAVIRKNKLTFAHVGDSRAYLFRNGTLTRLTLDHTKAQAQLSGGMITPEQLDKSPHRHFLTRAVGITERIELDIQQIALTKTDKILICSDGLTDMLSDKDIGEVLAKALTLEDSVAELIQAANAAGGLDNISIALSGII